jgi:hypothetical protein
MLPPEHEALIQGAIDGTLTDDEREAYRRLMAESADAQNRAAELEQLTGLIESLGQAEAPARFAGDVIRQISPSAQREPVRQFVPRTNPRRGVAVNKNLIFGLAAAAVVVLAVITFTSYPPATDGTEATIGAAQRAQTPQIAPADVKLADQSAQELLQSETWDAIMNDPDLYASLQDAELRRILEDAELRRALENDAVRRSLTDPELARTVKMLASKRGQALTEAEARSIKSAQVRAALQNEAFASALRKNVNLARYLMDARVSRALAGEAMARALRDRNFEAALKNRGFAEALARAKK